MSSGRKEPPAEKRHKNAVGGPYGNPKMKGVKQAQRDHSKSEVAHGEPSDSSTPRTLPTKYGSLPPKDHQSSYSFSPREGSQPNSTSHSQAGAIPGHTNATLPHRQEDFHGQPGGPLPASRNQNPTSKYAAADSLPQNHTGAKTYPPVQDAKRDQQSYSPGTQKVRRNADRTYHPDRDDKAILSVPGTATRHDARPNHGLPASEALTDRFDSMNIQSNVPGLGGSYQTTRHSSALSASAEKAREDAWISSKHASVPRELPQSAGNDSTNLSTRHEIPRRISPEANVGMRDERHQPRERPRVTYLQDDNEDDYGEKSSFKLTQDPRRHLPQQSDYSQSNNQSQSQPTYQVAEDSTKQPYTSTNHGRRLSMNQRLDLQIINEDTELRTTKTAESNRGKDKVLSRHYRIREDARSFFIVGRVFAMVWHETAGKEGTDGSWEAYSTDQFGGRIYSTIRRMVVVVVKYGHCICVPIATYGGRGTLKPGLSLAEIEAHAVIYMVGSSSAADPAEKIIKNPIAVVPTGPDQKLHPKSRINFDKVHTIEYNVKVMHVGRVAPDSLHNLSLYYQTTHFQPT